MVKKSPKYRIIVTGVPTSGKSTFARELTKKCNLEHFQIDVVIQAFQEIFPKLGIKHVQTIKEQRAVSKKFKKFLFSTVDALDSKRGNFIIEGFQIPLSDTFRKYNKTHQFFVFGFPNATPEERIITSRKYDPENWTSDFTDKQLHKIFSFLIQESKNLQKTCKRLHIPFIDTSENYPEAIRKAVKMLK